MSAGARPRRAPMIARLVLGVAALAALIVLGRRAGGYVLGFAGWGRGVGAWGPAVCIAGGVLGTGACGPGPRLRVGGGARFGAARGGRSVLAGAVCGSADAV